MDTSQRLDIEHLRIFRWFDAKMCIVTASYHRLMLIRATLLDNGTAKRLDDKFGLGNSIFSSERYLDIQTGLRTARLP